MIKTQKYLIYFFLIACILLIIENINDKVYNIINFFIIVHAFTIILLNICPN